MSHLNVEIKAICTDPEPVRTYLLQHATHKPGTDFQTDTYFHVAHGRLKLREGNIENHLIFYERENQAGPKSSYFQLYPVSDTAALKKMLTAANGIKVVVEKKREIYYIDNVKFHIDIVQGLGSFIEIEAGNLLADKTKDTLQQQCDEYIRLFNIKPNDLLEASYSDMLLQKGGLI